jgi:hypothetical protein
MKSIVMRKIIYLFGLAGAAAVEAITGPSGFLPAALISLFSLVAGAAVIVCGYGPRALVRGTPGHQRAVQGLDTPYAPRWARRHIWRAPRHKNHYRELGAIGNLAIARRQSLAATARRASRQHGGSAPRAATRTASGAEDGDGDGGGDPPAAQPQQLYSYASAAQILDCAVETLRNKACLGLIPRPLQTAVGPRFSDAQIRQMILAGTLPPAPRPRGRPRLAPVAGKGGAR